MDFDFRLDSTYLRRHRFPSPHLVAPQPWNFRPSALYPGDSLPQRMFGAFRTTRVLFDARNQFTKNMTRRTTQCQKRNSRQAQKIMMENMDIIREGQAALARVNARISTEVRAAQARAADGA